MKPVIKTGSFTKYQLADQMRNYMHVSDKFLEGLAVYKMVHMTGCAFSKLLHEGLIYREYQAEDISLAHNVIYHNCSPYHAKRAVEIRLSFRAAHAQFNIEPTVLVEIVVPFTAPITKDKEHTK